jgi:hypothetical protein
VGGACIHHGVSSVQITGLSPLHAEQALSWEQYDRVRSSECLLGQRIVVVSRYRLLGSYCCSRSMEIEG